jgi:sugar fermentation stimulation protein A
VRFTSPLLPARFLKRHKRFLALVELADSRQVWVHVPNSGALTGCAPPGGEILLTVDRSPGRKTDYTWRFVQVRPEVSLPWGSRLDFVLDLGEQLLFVEVKSVTWVEEGVALFPDGVTSRGRRHLEGLATLVRQGHRACQIFVVQRHDARVLKPAAAVDPAYARELGSAAAQGVDILVLQEKISPPEITLASELPFALT